MDVIANMLTKIRNATMRKAEVVEVQKSNFIEDILKVLKKEGYINDYRDSDTSPFMFLISLKYKDGRSVIQGLKRISKLSRRVYVKKDAVPSVFNNLGIAIVTTPKGVLTDKEARALGTGGELVCYIW